MKFEAGLREELLFLDSPLEHFVPALPQQQQQPGGAGGSAASDGGGAAGGGQSQRQPAAAGGVMLTSGAALECVYDGVRVVHRGTLRVTFSLLLKARGAAACVREAAGAALAAAARTDTRAHTRAAAAAFRRSVFAKKRRLAL
jgi:hypothetical protein